MNNILRHFPLALLSAALWMSGSTALRAQDPEAAGDKGAGKSFKELTPDLTFEDNIVYKKVAGQDLVLTVFSPKVKKFNQAPLVIYIHGGGWSGGNRQRVMLSGVIDVFRQLTAAGFVCAAIEYRLMKPKVATVFDSATDCKDAIRFMVKNASRFGIDPNRIGLIGGSAGGHLSLVTALSDDANYPGDPDLAKYSGKILAETAYFPLTSLVDPRMGRYSQLDSNPVLATKMLGGTLTEKKDLAEKLSPTLLVKPGAPAIRLVHGDNDKLLNDINSIALAQICKDKGVPVELVIVKGAGHVFSGRNLSPTIPEITKGTVAFFLKYLLPPGASSSAM